MWLNHTHAMMHSCVWHDSFIRVTWFILIESQYSRALGSLSWKHASVTWLIHTCAMTQAHSHVWLDVFTRVMWPLLVESHNSEFSWVSFQWNVTQAHSHVWLDAFMCVTQCTCEHMWLWLCFPPALVVYMWLCVMQDSISVFHFFSCDSDSASRTVTHVAYIHCAKD